jgi:cell division protein FtsI (penicillin-binding protein 3)
VSQWSETSIATIAIGQGVAVTAIQMLAAYNTIANGGVYVAPKIVAATVDSSGQTIPTPASATHRVVSPQVAAEMNTMLGEVVRVGTGQTAKINGYTVAGKTGTALIPLQDARGYATGVYASSFAGFVPAEHPDLTAIVVLDQTPLFGAVAAAPAFSTIAGDALRDFEIAPVPPQPPAPGVPLATPETAQAAGETLGPITAAVKLPPVTKANSDDGSRSTTTSTTTPPATAATLPRRNGLGSASPTATLPTATTLPAKR